MRFVIAFAMLTMAFAFASAAAYAQSDSGISSATENIAGDVQPDAGAPAPDAKYLDEIWRCERYVDDKLVAEFDLKPLANDEMDVTYG